MKGLRFSFLRRFASSLAVAGVGVGVTIFCTILVYQSESASLKLEFRQLSAERFNVIEQGLQRRLGTLAHLEAFFLAGPMIEREEFREYLEEASFEDDVPGAFAWIPRVKPDDQDLYLARAMRDGLTEFMFWKSGVVGQREKVARDESIYPVYFLEGAANEFDESLGFDLGSRPNIAEAMRKARLEKRTVFSYEMFDRIFPEATLVALQPVFRRFYEGDKQVRRFSGYLAAFLKLDDIMTREMEVLRPAGIDIAIYDLHREDNDQLIYFHPSRTHASATSSKAVDFATVRNQIHALKAIQAADRPWVMVSLPTDDRFSSAASWIFWAVLAGAMTITFLLTAYMYILIQKREGAEELASFRARKLADSAHKLIQAEAEKRKAELDLELSETDLHNIIAASPEGIVVLDEHGRILYMNRSAEQFFGRVLGSMKGEKFDYPLRHNEVTEIKVEMDNGRIRQAELRMTLIQWEGRDARLVLIHDDTDRTAAEERVKASEGRLKTLFEYAPDAIFITDLKGTFVDGNRVAEEISGYRKEDLIGKNYLDLKMISAGQMPLALKSLTQTALGKPTGPDIYEMRTKTGDKIELEIRTYPVVIEGKRYVQGIARDVSDRRAAERAIQSAREEAQKYLDIADVMIVALNADGTIRMVNRKGAQVLGYDERELVGQSWFDKVLPEEDREKVRNFFGEVISGEMAGIEQIENHILNKEGDLRLIAWRNSLLEDDEGNIVGTLSSGEDITDRKQLEQQFSQAQKMESIGQLAGGVAHDFNNHLSIIQGYAQLLKQALKSDPAKLADLDQIVKATSNSAYLTQQLLAFSRRQVIKPVVLDLNDVILQTSKMLMRLLGEHIELVTLPAAALWKIKMDSGQLEQILMNLSVNARDAMPKGGVLRVVTQNVTLGPEFVRGNMGAFPGSYVMLAIQDSGIGMDEATRQKVFEPFFTTKEKGKGTGLGLSMCYGIVKQNHGYIAVESTPGDGTCFKIYFPVAEKVEEAEKDVVADDDMPRGTETILVAEDEGSLRELTVRILSELGYTVLAAGHGEEALRLVQDNEDKPIDLLLTDVVMPKMGGKELAEKIAGQYPDTKIMFMSGYPDAEMSHEGVIQNDIAYLKKPFSPSELAIMIRKVLDGPRRKRKAKR